MEEGDFEKLKNGDVIILKGLATFVSANIAIIHANDEGTYLKWWGLAAKWYDMNHIKSTLITAGLDSYELVTDEKQLLAYRLKNDFWREVPDNDFNGIVEE